MKTSHSLLSAAIAFGLLLSAGPALASTASSPETPPASSKATDPMTEAQVRALLASQGYKEINDVEFKEGTWTADAESADGKHVEVRVDSTTGKIIPDKAVATIDKDQIIVLV